MRRFVAVSAVVSMVFPASSFAQSFKILGTRPLGMGGAHVAVAEGTVAQYWNPAGLAVRKGFDLEFPLGAGAEFTKGLLKEADDLSTLSTKIDAIQAKSSASPDALTLQQYKDFMNVLVQVNDLNKDGLGLVAEIQGGADLRVGRFAVSYNNFTEVGVDPYVDTKNMGLSGGTFGSGIQAAYDFDSNGMNEATALPSGVSEADEDALESVITSFSAQVNLQLPASAGAIANELIQQASAGGQSASEIVSAIHQIQEQYAQVQSFLPSGLSPFTANQTSLSLQGASVGELAMGYGWNLTKRLSVGANLKMMQAKVGYARVNVMDEDTELGDLQDDYKKNLADSTAFGADVGVLYDLKDTRWKSRLGVTARNVNSPKFDQPQAAKDDGIAEYKVKPQLRAGLAWHPFNWMVVAGDVDLSENETSLPGYKSRLVGGGMEINVFNRSWLNLALRGGAMKNIAESESALAYTAGLGLNILHLNVDLGGAMSSKTVDVEDGGKIPASARVAVNVGLRF
jgi:hypothetical protein